jgi:hypothetical protein
MWEENGLFILDGQTEHRNLVTITLMGKVLIMKDHLLQVSLGMHGTKLVPVYDKSDVIY